jgi:hypothetical protein
VQFTNLGRQTLNSAGQIAFRAGLTGTGVGAANNLGIWATDQNGALQLIARTGSQLEIAPGVFRTTSDLGFALDSGNSDGRASAFNDLGQLVFWASFTNGTQGVFVSSAVAHLPGDFNNDGTVDAADYVVWRNNDGTQTGYDTWRANFGRRLFTGSGAGAIAQLAPGDPAGANYAVPEPAGILLAATALGVLILRRPRRASAGCQWLCQCQLQLSKCTGKACDTRIPTHTLRVVSAVAICAALQLAPDITAEGAMLEFDSSRKSPAVMPIDPDGLFEARGNYVSGRVPTDVKGPVRGGTNINTLVGADAFYSQGYSGTNAVIANVEGGQIWSGHETLTHVQQIMNHPSALNEFHRHATWVGMVLGGRQGGANPGPYQQGLAPNAQLFSGSIATQFNGQRLSGNFNTTDAITFDQYRKAFSTGMDAAGRTADVINSSWGGQAGSNGSDNWSIALDGLANSNPRTLFAASAGNEGPGPDKVARPAAAYNNLSVAALGPNPPYDRPSSFSSGGPNDYADPVNGTVNNARQVVDIAAPGENLSAAYYGGETGGNGTTDNPAVSGPGPTGLPSGPLGGPDFYTRGGVSGTSFAAPTVAGGAALLYDAAYSVFPDNADARDARVMKAVLMNSADKTIGWNNGQVAHPNASGGVLTTQGLDNRVGAGRLNLAAAYDQFLTGTTDVAGTSSGDLGIVNDIGWDFGQVVSGTTNDYFFDSPLPGGSTFTATLSWFRDRRIDASNTLFDDSYDDLNLELWSVIDGTPASLISESSSLYNESEHFSFALPATGDYALRVRWYDEVFDMIGDADQEFYGLAWATAALGVVAIPEPASALLFLTAAMVVAIRGRSRRPGRVLQIAAPMFPLVAFVVSARADIFQWEYVDPANPALGKRQSTTLCPGGAGVDAMPGANLSYRELTMAYLDGADLTNAFGMRTYLGKATLVGANLSGAHFTRGDEGDWDESSLYDADLSQANLSDATFAGYNFMNADLTGAEIRGASFNADFDYYPYFARLGGLTLAQLYSTASYQTYDLAGINLGGNKLTGGNFAGQNNRENRRRFGVGIEFMLAEAGREAIYLNGLQ